MMDAMESYAQGWWRPSPGSIYPFLETMVKEGVLSRSDDKKYSLTPKGLEEIERPYSWADRGQSPRSPEQVLEQMSGYISYLEDIARTKDHSLAGDAGKIKELGDRLAKLGDSS